MRNRSDRKKLEAIFFDFDGVLVDSTTIKEEGFATLFSHLPEAALSRILSYHRLHGGVSRVEKIRYAYREVLEEKLPEEKLQRLAAHYSELVVEKVVACDEINGATQLLNSFRGKCEILLISGTPEEELREIIARRGMEKFFREISGSPVGKVEHIERMLENYTLSQNGSVFIGDALTDYHAARKTGLDFIGIQGAVSFPKATMVLPDCTGIVRELRERGYDW